MGAVITIGMDIGQRVDPTAIAVAEADRRPGEREQATHYLIRHIERLPLGTSYPDVARRLAVVVNGVAQRLAAAAGSDAVGYAGVAVAGPAAKPVHPTVFVDATGVGKPVVDILKEAAIAARIVPCWFTHGDRRTYEGGEVRIGKAFLVSRLQSLLQTGRIHLPATAEARALADELQNYEIKVDEKANDTYGAFKVGTHDDLVTALGLAVQGDLRPRWRVL